MTATTTTTAAAAFLLSQKRILSPSNNTTTVNLASTSLGFLVYTRQEGTECHDLCHEYGQRDEHDRERERKRTLSIVPSSSFSNFPSGLEGLAVDAQNSHLCHHQPPPLSAVSGASANMFSDLLSETGTSGGAGVGVGEERSLDEWTRLRSKCGGCTRVSRPTRHMRTGGGRGRFQLEERMQKQHIHPPDQMM